jgi:predicted outer membrane repeat protein
MTDGWCNLREAITAANDYAIFRDCPAGNGADTIVITATGTILLNSILPNITEAVSIIGPGADSLTIDADETYRIFRFDSAEPGEQFRLEKMTLLDGLRSFEPAAVYVLDDVDLVMEDMVISGMRLNPNGSGAVSGQNASITIRRSTFFNNGSDNGSGSAIQVSSSTTVVIEDSTFENNFVNDSTNVGGAISIGNGCNVTIRRSTFSGNTAGDRGGAIAMFASNAVLNIESSTFANNSAGNSGGAIDINAGTVSIKNSLFAFNQISGVVVGDPTRNINLTGSGVINTLGYNAIADNSGAAVVFPAGAPNVNDDYVGTALATLNVQIGLIGDNGGPTRTHAILPGSPLIDAGSCTGEPYDQRRYSNLAGGRIVDRPVANADDGCDIGAFELGAQAPVLDFADGFEDPPEP